MKTKLRKYSKPVVSILLALVLMTSTLVTGVIAAGGYKATVKESKTEAAAVSAADSKTTSVEAETDNSADTAVKNTASSAVNKKKDKKQTGANAKNLTGYSNGGYVKGSWDNWANKHSITNGYTVPLAASTTYELVFVASDNEDVFKTGTTISSSVTNYNFPKSGTSNVKLKTTIAGDYTFKWKSYSGSGDSMSVDITYPVDNTPDTWTVVGGTHGNTNGGQSDPLFTETWNTTLTQNNMTNTSGTTWRWSKNNVTLTAGKILCKVVKNHSYDTAYPTSGNQESASLAAGTYNVTITFNSSTKAVTITATEVAKKTLTVKNNIANATVTATYNGTTVGENQSISNIPQGATVSISVTPDTGYQCTGITSSGGGTISGSINSYTLKMPAQNTTIDATIEAVTLKKIYFNNNYTQYGTVYAYVYDKDGTNHTYKYLGSRPGKVMKETENTEMWYIEVPSDVDYVEFISGDGKTTGELTIPWGTHTYPKYTAPYNYDAPTTANGGAWGNYKWGDKVGDQRDNVYNVSKGSTMGASNLFTGISGTLFDYYVDDEVTGSWLTGTATHAANYNNSGLTSNDPYKKLNANLSAYADADKTSSNANWSNPSQPKYGTTYPLYFGDLNVDAGNSLVSSYYNFVKKVNNSNGLSVNKNALTGLSGNKLGDDDTIHYYKDGATNENGAPMAMFNEDFLSGENKTGETLATILRTSSFPVRKEASVKTLCLDMSSHQGNWEDASAAIVANFHNGNTTSGNLRVLMVPYGSDKYYVEIPSGYTQVEWLRFDPAVDYADSSVNAWNYKNAGAFGTNNTYKFSSGSGNSVSGSWSKNTTLATGHDYYEYDSTNGKDNAFITDINTTNKTANIDYYDSASGKSVKSAEKGSIGFFPFDYNNVISNTTVYPTDTIYVSRAGYYPEGNNEYWYAYLYDSSNTSDDQWVKMQGTGDVISFTNPDTSKYDKATFMRKSRDSTGWSNIHNQKDDIILPNGTNNKVQYKFSSWFSGDWEAKSSVTGTKVNDFADTTNHYAHDQGFGMKLEIPFTLRTDGLNEDGTHQIFSFSGDDDLWVFVDDKLVLDLGGAHARTTGFIDFNTKTITANNTQSIGSGSRNGSFSSGFNTNPNYVHTMTIYYMERGMFESNLKFGFSFHAIPNQFWIDKKIRTKDKYNLGYDTINSGFFTDNNQTGDASNMTTHTVGGKTVDMSKFEKSFQDEEFTVTQWFGTSSASTLASGKNYTIDNDSTTYTTGSNGQYPIYHDLGNAFIGQFTTGNKFKLKETISSSNKYVYTPEFSVWDQANNDKSITFGGDNTNGYTFDFSPIVATPAGGLENTNIKARFDNYMVAHDLTLTKEITNATDTTTDFTFKILFDFEDNDNYVAYPLYCDVDGERTKLSDTGTITVNAGQEVVIIDIPEKAKIQVTEVLTDTVSGYRYDGIALTKGGSEVTPDATVTKGVQFCMGDADMSAVISNKKPDNKYTITYKYTSYGASPKTSSLYGEQSYTVTGVFTEKELQTYMTLDANNKLTFGSNALKKTFVNIKAPYEDNFMQDLSFATSDIDETGMGWDANGDYSCAVTATGDADYNINAYFDLPYAVNNNTDLVPQTSGTSGKVAYITKTAHGEKNITCYDWYVTSGKKNAKASGSDPVFIKAPLIVYENVNDESTKKYFQYWSVKSQSGYGKKTAEYTRCYDYEFNLSLFMDCVIEPVYATTWAQITGGNPNPPSTYNNYERFDPELQITGDSTKGISIAFLENSRNQFNNNGGGSRSGAAADTIYSDFLLSFNKVAGITQLNQLSAGTKNAGIVIEAVNNLDGDNSSGFNTNKDYNDDTNFTNTESTSSTNIIAWLQGGSKPSNAQKRQFDVRELDNKNCIQYYVSFKNRNLGDNSVLLNTNNNRYKVFRAYAYIGGGSGNSLTNVTLSQPIYFTIYDIGSNGLNDNLIQ